MKARFKLALVSFASVLASQSALAADGFFVCTDVRGRIISAAISGEAEITNAKISRVQDPASQPAKALEVRSASMLKGNVSISLVEPGEEEQQVYEIHAKSLNGTSDATIKEWLGDTAPVQTRGSCVIKFTPGA